VRTFLEKECALTCESPTWLIPVSLALSAPASCPFTPLKGRRKRKEKRKIRGGGIGFITAQGVLNSGSWCHGL